MNPKWPKFEKEIWAVVRLDKGLILRERFRSFESAYKFAARLTRDVTGDKITETKYVVGTYNLYGVTRRNGMRGKNYVLTDLNKI